MALSPIAFIPPGCSPQCALNVISKANTFVYASIQGVLLYRADTKSVPNAKTGGASDSALVSIPHYPLASIFGHGVRTTVKAFDYNTDYMACLVAGSPSVLLWKLANAEALTSKKIPPALETLFKSEANMGSPSTLCMAGKHHLLIGTTTGGMVSLNTNAADGLPGEPRSMKIPVPVVTPTADSSSSSKPRSAASVECVLCVAASPARADFVACGTADGTLCFMTLSASTGLRATASFYPFPPSGKEKDRLLAPDPLPVSVVAFDPSTVSHLVAASSTGGGLVLCDFNADQRSSLQYFDCKDGVSAVAWVIGEDNTFLTVKNTSNVVSKWKAGSKAAVASFAPVATSLGICGIACLDKERIVLTLTSGSVLVYRMGAQQVEFRTEKSHTDVVLHARFSMHDRDHIATAGLDGAVRVWNLKTMSLLHDIQAGEVAVYGVDWSPNGKYLVAALGNGEVVQYVCATNRQGWRTTVFPDPVFCVLWAGTSGDANIIICCSRAGVALLSSKDGQVARRFSPPGGTVYCIDLEITKGKTLAVGCQDHKVYLYNLSTNCEAPVLTLSGHTDAVTVIAYNPTVPNFLLTGSRDSTLRIWDLSSNDSHSVSVGARILKGHSDRVQCAAWCSLAPYLVVSGSADATLHLWDVRNGIVITAARGHSGEVCAVTTHPERPLIFLSASRDGSIIAWSLALLRQVYLNAALGTLECCIAPPTPALLSLITGAPPSVTTVAGGAVQRLLKELTQCSKPTERSEKIMGFFDFPFGSADLAQLAHYAADPNGCVADGKTLVVPKVKLLETRRARAKQMVEKVHGKTVAAAGPAYRKQRFTEVARELLLVGQVEEYCNTLMEAEAWDQAIAAAPMVGRDYWRSVCIKAAEAMEQIGDPRAVTYYIIAEESAKAALLLANRRSCSGDFDAAAVICLTCPQHDSKAPAQAGGEPVRQTFIDTQGSTTVAQALRQSCFNAVLQHQEPRLWAALQLERSCNDEAVRALGYAGDVVMTHLLVHTIPLREQSSIDTAYYLAMLQCARMRQWDTAVLCATRHSNPYHAFATLIANFQFAHGKQVCKVPTHSVTSMSTTTFQGVSDKLKAFYEKIIKECANLQLSLDPAAIQQKHANDGLASQNQIAAMVIGSDPLLGPTTSTAVLQSISGFFESLLSVALQDIDGVNSSFYLKQAFNVTCYVVLPIHIRGSPLATKTVANGVDANTPAFPTTLTAEHKKFLALCYLLAALLCVKVYRFPTLLNTAFVKAREMAVGHSAVEDLCGKAQAALGAYSPHSIAVDTAPVAARIPVLTLEGKQLMSFLSSQPVYGAAHMLEDGTSILSKEEALAWGLCCNFSPLATGARMMVL